MKKYFNLLVLLLASIPLYAQTPYIEWQRCLGWAFIETPSSIIMTKDGGFVIICNTVSSVGNIACAHGLNDAWVIKLDQTGQVLWRKCMGGSWDDRFRSIAETNDGGYLIVGYTMSNDGDITGNHGDIDVWIVKLDQSGNIVSNKCFGGSGIESVSSIIETKNGEFIVAGGTGSNDSDILGNHGKSDGLIIKLDQSGNILSSMCYGNSEREGILSVRETKNGEFIAAGSVKVTDEYATDDHWGTDWWVLKIDQSGQVLWEKTFGGSNDEMPSTIEVEELRDGCYLIAGDTRSNDGSISGNHGKTDIWLAKLDQSGQILWNKCLGGLNGESVYSLEETVDNGLLLAGYTLSNDGDVSGNHGSFDIWLIKMDQSGNILWQNCIGGNSHDEIRSVIEISGGFIIAGYTFSNDGDVSGNHGQSDYWLAKLNQYGQVIGQKSLGGSSLETVNHVIQVSDNEYVMAGFTRSNDGDVLGHGTQDSNDIWVVKLGIETSVFEEDIAGSLSIISYLNPDNIIIKTNLFGTDEALRIYNIYGQVVYSGNIEQEITVDISGFAAGTYFVSAGNERNKFIKY